MAGVGAADKEGAPLAVGRTEALGGFVGTAVGEAKGDPLGEDDGEGVGT